MEPGEVEGVQGEVAEPPVEGVAPSPEADGAPGAVPEVPSGAVVPASDGDLPPAGGTPPPPATAPVETPAEAPVSPAVPATHTLQEQPSSPDGVLGDSPGLVVGGGLALAIAAIGLVTVARRNAPQLEVEERPALTGPAATAPDAPKSPPAEDKGLAARLRERMAGTRAALQGQFDKLFGTAVDEELLEQLEEVLLVADVGLPTTQRILKTVTDAWRGGERDPEALRGVMRAEISVILHAAASELAPPPASGPLVLLVVGVNGSGKTTTIGKLAARYQASGKTVLLAAGDTYRAAASEQLQVWAVRAKADFVSHAEGSDPGAVVYDALDAAKARGIDVVIVDTAGRLQTARPLMEQLTKMRRIIDKKVPGAPHETLLIIDGTMGQNALSQARSFHEAAPLTGVVVTKLDGTAKGGMVLAISSEMGLPIKFIGIGEQVDDLRVFEPEAFLEALA